MKYTSPTVNAVAFLAICGAVVLSPIYAVWIAGGMVADWREKKMLFQRAREFALAPIGHQK